MGVAEVANRGDPPEGIMGIGFSSDESRVDRGDQPYPGYIRTLAAQGLINTRAYSIFLDDLSKASLFPVESKYTNIIPAPTDEASGTIIFGGYDSSRFTGNLIAFPIIEPAPGGGHRLDIFGPSITFIFNGQEYFVPPSSTTYTVIMDTGLAITRIPEDQFPIISSTIDIQIIGNGPFYSVDCALRNEPGGFHFSFSGPHGSTVIQVPWAELVLPRDRDDPPGRCTFGLAANPIGRGIYAFGDTFLRSTYIYYNYETRTISLAQAHYDHDYRGSAVTV